MNCAAATSSSCPDAGGGRRGRRRSSGASARPAALTSALVCAALGWATAPAAVFDASITQRGVYDSSPRLAFAESESIYGYILEPSFSLEQASPRWNFLGELDVALPLYDDADFNLDEERLQLTLVRSLPRSRFSLYGDYDRDSTLTNILLLEPDDPVLNDVNESQASRRTSATFAPRWTRALGPRNTLQVGGAITDVTFEENVEVLELDEGTFELDRGFTDYRFESLDVSLERAFTERISGFASVSVSRLVADDRTAFLGNVIEFVPPDMLVQRPVVVSTSSRNFSRQVLVGATRQFTPRLSATVRGGARFVTSTSEQTDLIVGGPTVTDSEDTTGAIFNGTVEWDSGRTLLRLRLDRTLSPSGVGQLLEQDDVSVFARQRLGRRLRATLRMGYTRRDRLIEGDALNREVYRVLPTLNWDVTRRWDLVFGVRFASATGFEQEGRVEGVRTFVGVTYDFERSELFR